MLGCIHLKQLQKVKPYPKYVFPE